LSSRSVAIEVFFPLFASELLAPVRLKRGSSFSRVTFSAGFDDTDGCLSPLPSFAFALQHERTDTPSSPHIFR
jgi:hypothetical protein